MSATVTNRVNGVQAEIKTTPKPKSKPDTAKRQPTKPTWWKRRVKDSKAFYRWACKQSNKLQASAIGIVSTGMIGLSVSHLTESIASLTHTDPKLGMLMAIGIDCNLVLAEIAALTTPDGKKGEWQHGKWWAYAYVLLAVLLSCCLNAHAFSAHSVYQSWEWFAGIGFGVILPVLVFVSAKVAGHKWQQK